MVASRWQAIIRTNDYLVHWLLSVIRGKLQCTQKWPQYCRCRLPNIFGKQGFLFWLKFHSWWRQEMEEFSALLALCAGNSPVTGEFPSQRPVTRSFNVFFDLRLNKRLNKQIRFETPSRSSWRHCNVKFVPRWALRWLLTFKSTELSLHWQRHRPRFLFLYRFMEKKNNKYAKATSSGNLIANMI